MPLVTGEQNRRTRGSILRRTRTRSRRRRRRVKKTRSLRLMRCKQHTAQIMSHHPICLLLRQQTLARANANRPIMPKVSTVWSLLRILHLPAPSPSVRAWTRLKLPVFRTKHCRTHLSMPRLRRLRRQSPRRGARRIRPRQARASN